MKKKILGLLISGAMVVGLPSLAVAQQMLQPMGAAPVASAPLYTLKPLMVIRFNQRKVYFEQPLFNTLSRALSVKPDASFEVVGAGSVGQSDKVQASLRQVIGNMQSIGIPAQHISSRIEQDASTQSPEVRIFVR